MSDLTHEERVEIFRSAAIAAAKLNPVPGFKVLGSADNAHTPPKSEDDPEVAGVYHPNHPKNK